jgi:hypothetical protein
MLRPRAFGVEHHEPKHRLQHEERTAQRGVEPNPQALSNKEGGDIAGTDAELMRNVGMKINSRSSDYTFLPNPESILSIEVILSSIGGCFQARLRVCRVAVGIP